ncbi:hypothetical protein ACROYT_G033878 [Oculina patagonica]
MSSGQWSGNPINCTDILPPTFGATCPARFQPVVTSNYQPLQRLSQGTHVITYTAVDQSGNKATCSFAIEVIVINCTSLTVDPSGPLRIEHFW